MGPGCRARFELDRRGEHPSSPSPFAVTSHQTGVSAT